MPWTTPKTDWETGELVAASDMNAIGENFAALQHPATAAYITTADISKTLSEFGDVDSDNLNLTITTTGGDVLVHFHGLVNLGEFQSARIDVEVDGTRQGGDDGIVHIYADRQRGAKVRETPSFTRLIQNLSAGSHTFKLQWKGNVIVKAGAQFWVREI